MTSKIGCGGTILKLVGQNPDFRVHWVVFSSDPVRAAESWRSAGLFLKDVTTKEVTIGQFRDSFFPWEGHQIKGSFESLKGISPDLILTHNRGDLQPGPRANLPPNMEHVP